MFMQMVSVTAAALHGELLCMGAMGWGASWTPLGTRCYPIYSNRAGSRQQVLGAQKGPRAARRCLLGFGGFLNRCLHGASVPTQMVRKWSGSCY